MNIEFFQRSPKANYGSEQRVNFELFSSRLFGRSIAFLSAAGETTGSLSVVSIQLADGASIEIDSSKAGRVRLIYQAPAK